MYKIVKVYKTRLNSDYTGVIHMARYTNSDNYKETGIMFLEQNFNDGRIINKCSFFGKEGSYSVDKESIEEDFNIKVHFAYGQGEFISSIDYEGTPYFLYDDYLGDYDLIQSLESKISSLSSTVSDLENQVTYIKRKNKNDFARKMDKR